jgi:hypothetical protein
MTSSPEPGPGKSTEISPLLKLDGRCAIKARSIPALVERSLWDVLVSRLGRGFLTRVKVDFGSKSLISRQLNLDPMLSGTDRHGMECSSEIASEPDVTVIDKYRCSVRNYVELQRRAVGAGVLRS